MTTEKAIIEFEKQLKSAMAILDSGFGTHPGECDLLYRKRKEMAEAALVALRAQPQTKKNDPLTLEEPREIVCQLESCEYECVAGPLKNKPHLFG